MRKIILIAVATAALLTGTAAPALAAPGLARPTAGEFNRCGYEVTTDGVHLRSGPGTRYASLGLLRHYDAMSVDRASGDWYHVTLSADSAGGTRALTTGWVHKRYLTPSTCMQLD
ncbi:SH3 domain-containing protein [Streptomyces hydrogenans]|uniref:SH3 domain-containing protein n=1 Tax=Streptomyces hydrogenans TaxID=1873719 RepID=UPI0035E23136